jgi:cytochrome P450
MFVPAEPDPYHLDLSAPELIFDPYPTYARLRANRGVHYWSSSTTRRVAVLSRYADVQLALNDPRFGRRGNPSQLQTSLGEGPLSRSIARWMVLQDAPDRTRLRRLVMQAFTPVAVQRLSDQVRAIVEPRLAALAGRDWFDLVAEFAAPLRVLLGCALLGVPPEGRPRFGGWSSTFSTSLDQLMDPEAVLHTRADVATSSLTVCLRELVDERRQAPSDDLLANLVRVAQEDGTLGEEDLLATCALVYLAGQASTINMIGNAALALLRHPHELAWLQENPDRAASGIDELIRFDSPLQRVGRFALADVELPEGDVIAAGEWVNVLIGAANRDTARFADAHQLDLTRPNAGRHLTFRAEVHDCLSAPLARLEAHIAVAELVRRIPNLHLVDEPPVWRSNHARRGLQALPVAG